MYAQPILWTETLTTQSQYTVNLHFGCRHLRRLAYTCHCGSPWGEKN